MSIKGFKSQQALSKKLGGYTEDQSIDQARYVTVQEMNGKRHALDVIIQGAYQITITPLTVASGSNIRVIKCVAHGANKNDIIRLLNGTQFSALSIPDADTIITSVELDVDPTGDTFTIWRHITPAYNADGSLNVSIIPSPVSYNRKVAGITSTTVVLEDEDTPSNSRALPVVIHSIDGAPINITAGDLNVQLSDQGANPDVTKIGDGTNRLGINSNLEAKTHDDDILSKLTDKLQQTQLTNGTISAGVKALNNQLVATDVGLITNSAIHGITTAGGGAYVDVKVNPSGALTVESTVVSSTLPTGASTSALQTSGNASLTSIDTKLTSQATAANQTTELTRIGDVVETAPASDTASSGLNGRLQRIAQRLTSLIALLPTSIGTKTSVASLSVVIASDQAAIPVSVGSSALPTGAATGANQTLQLAQETNINTVLGITSDAVATTDTGTFSLIALTKRIAQNITTMSAKLPAALGVQGSGASLSVVQASSSSFSVVDVVRVPTYAESLVITQASAITLSAPATARTMKVQSDNTNSVNLRYKIAATPTATSGHQLEPGRSEDWTVAGDVVVIAESTASAQKIYVTWGA